MNELGLKVVSTYPTVVTTFLLEQEEKDGSEVANQSFITKKETTITDSARRSDQFSSIQECFFQCRYDNLYTKTVKGNYQRLLKKSVLETQSLKDLVLPSSSNGFNHFHGCFCFLFVVTSVAFVYNKWKVRRSGITASNNLSNIELSQTT